MNTKIRFSAAVLAGGQSRRMGFDKSTLLVGNQTLLDHQLQLLQLAGASELLLASGDPRRQWPIPPGILVRFVPDSVPNAGPLAGIAATLAAAQEEHLLVLAVDMPQMTVSLLAKLVALAQPGRGVIPLVENQFEPVAALYPRKALPAASKILASGRFALKPFATLGIEEGWLLPWPVPQADRACFANWNSPADVTPDHDPS